MQKFYNAPTHYTPIVFCENVIIYGELMPLQFGENVSEFPIEIQGSYCFMAICPNGTILSVHYYYVNMTNGDKLKNTWTLNR